MKAGFYQGFFPKNFTRSNLYFIESFTKVIQSVFIKLFWLCFQSIKLPTCK